METLLAFFFFGFTSWFDSQQTLPIFEPTLNDNPFSPGLQPFSKAGFSVPHRLSLERTSGRHALIAG